MESLGKDLRCTLCPEAWELKTQAKWLRCCDPPRYSGFDPAHRLSSETGKQLLDEAIGAHGTWFVETVATLREKLDTLDLADVMDDVDLVRYDCYRPGQFAGPSVWIHDEHGAGLRSRNAVDRPIEDHDPDSLWVVPADVHY